MELFSKNVILFIITHITTVTYVRTVQACRDHYCNFGGCTPPVYQYERARGCNKIT